MEFHLSPVLAFIAVSFAFEVDFDVHYLSLKGARTNEVRFELTVAASGGGKPCCFITWALLELCAAKYSNAEGRQSYATSWIGLILLTDHTIMQSRTQADFMENKGTSFNVGGGSVNVNTGKEKPGGTAVNVGKGGVSVNTGKRKPGGGTHVNVGGQGVGVNTGKPGGGTFVNVGGKETATFLPRHIAQKILFSSDKLPEILNKFSVKPGSAGAEIMKNTIKECEQPQIQGEDKYCVTSLESMIDFSTSKIGKNAQHSDVKVRTVTTAQSLPGLRTSKKGPEMSAMECGHT
ncbi:hypothetical protein SCA6_012206 [Theobroma cacao]